MRDICTQNEPEISLFVFICLFTDIPNDLKWELKKIGKQTKEFFGFYIE